MVFYKPHKPQGYQPGIPKEDARAADAKIREEELNYELPKIPKKEDELREEMVKNTNVTNAKTLEYHNLIVKPIPEPAPVPTSSTYPTSKEYLEFHNDFTLYRKPLNFTIKDDILTVTNSIPNGRPLTIGMYAIISILGEKFSAPIMESIDLKKGFKTLPDFNKLDAQLKQKWWDYRCCFTDLYQYSVPRVEKECMMYHELMALPLFHRIQFLEWEKSLVAQKVTNGIIDGLKERDAQLEQIRKDYLTKYENEKTMHRTEFDKFHRDTQKYNIILEQLKARNDNLSQKLETLNSEHGECYQKLQDSEGKTETAQRELTNLKIKVTELEKKVLKYEVDPWLQDSNSTDDKPTYYNKFSGDIVSYPENFKKSYHLNRKEGDVLVYMNDKGDKFKLPETLILHQKKATMKATIIDADVDNGNASGTRKERIFNTLSDSDEALSIVEISEITGILKNHVYAEIKAILKTGTIEEIYDSVDEVNKYTPL